MKKEILESAKTKVKENAIIIIAAVMIILGTLSYNFVSNWAKRVSSGENHEITRQGMVERADRDAKAINVISQLNGQINADRTLVFSLHNGAYWSSGEPIIKYSARYESDAVGVAPVSDQLQNLLISQAPSISYALAEPSKITFVQRDTADLAVQSLMYSIGIKSTCYQPIYKNGSPIGMLAIHFKESKAELSKEEIENFKVAHAILTELFLRDIKN